MSDVETTQYASLKREILLRIQIQNWTIMLAVLSAVPFIALAILFPAVSVELGLGYVVCSGALALQWCHNGVRQKALKAFLVAMETKRLGEAGSWEASLPALRPPGLLGSRWFISTKGVFIGLQLTLLALPFIMGAEIASWVYALSLLGMAVTAGLLLTNPKE